MTDRTSTPGWPEAKQIDFALTALDCAVTMLKDRGYQDDSSTLNNLSITRGWLAACHRAALTPSSETASSAFGACARQGLCATPLSCDREGKCLQAQTPSSAGALRSDEAGVLDALAVNSGYQRWWIHAGRLHFERDGEPGRIEVMLPHSCTPQSARMAFDQRAADYIIEMSGDQIGHGDDPVRFLIASHRVLREKLGIQNNRLSDLVSLILQARSGIPPMRDRKDYPSELQKAIDFLHGRDETTNNPPDSDGVKNVR